MSPAAKDYIRKLLATGQTPQQIKTNLVASGWEESVIDQFILEVNSTHSLKSTTQSQKSHLFLLIPILILVILGILFIFLRAQLTPNTSSSAAATPTPPQFTASPSALLLNPTDSEKIRIGLSKLFAPPQFSYIATLSARLNSCSANFVLDSKTATDSSYFKSSPTSSTNCNLPNLSANYLEFYRLPTTTLYKTNSTAKFRQSTSPASFSLPQNPNETLQKLFPSDATWEILASRQVVDGTEIKTSVSSSSLSGTYTLTIRPAGFQIISANFEANLNQANSSINYAGSVLFRNRAMIVPPPNNQIE